MHRLILLLALIGPRFLTAKVIVRETEHYCTVREPKFSYEFDFSVLNNKTNDYVIRHDEGVYLRLHACDQLKTPCNGTDGYSICLSKEGKEIGIGKEPPNIVKEFGEIIFKYTGEPCDSRHNYTVNIKMICDLAVKDGNEITLYAAGYNECDFNMNWRTEAACVKEKKQIKCSVDDKTGHYDLSELINLSDNYMVFLNDNKHAVILNVCHSVLYGPYVCKSTNGACLIDTDKESAVKNLGEPKEDLVRNPDGTLTLTYKDGGLCNVNTPNAPLTISTKITFICDLNAISTLPQYVGGMEECTFNFKWKTAAACSEEVLHNKSLEQKNTNTCTLKDPVSSYVYNFTTLINKEHIVKPFGTNEVYRFSICGSVTNTTCKKGTGACKIHKNTSGGIGNSKLMWKESGPYLNYTNGDLCPFNKQQRYTILEFYCGSDDDYEIEETGYCYDVIKISTNLACNQQKRVCTTNNYEVNFERLMLKYNNYVVQTPDAEFHINVCRPLVSEAGLNCPEGTGICKITVVNGKPSKAVSLGYPDQNPSLTNYQSALLIYQNGSVCEEDKTRRIESRISFLCDINSELGHPVFKSYSNCTYFFEWRINIACGKVYGSYHPENCTITNVLGDSRNLWLLTEYESPIASIMNDKGILQARISLCGKRDCNGGYICDDKMNYGSKVSVLTDYTVNLVRLDFTDGSKCSDGSSAQSTLTITCHKDQVFSKPILLWKQPCRAAFEWQTSSICGKSKFVEMSKLSKNETVAVSKISNSLNGVEITGIVIFVLMLMAIICYAARRSRFIEMISNSTSRNCDRVKYSRVNTMEECHLLLNTSDPTVIETDSDDDELLDA